MSQATLQICYVCNDYVNLDADRFCRKDFEDGKKFRHLWHGAPGITRAVGGGGGLKELFKDDWLMDLIGDAGGGEENLQALPFLLQLFTNPQQGHEFDPSSYFQ